MKLIVGLGNPGREYANNRHNIGFMCVSHLGARHGIRFDKKQSQARTGQGEIAGMKVALARPQTHMNLSGQSVSLLVARFAVSLEDLVVIHDDIDLPLGKIRIRHNGSSGGHKGIGSIITELGSPDFVRVRVGIGRPVINEGVSTAMEEEVINHVLGDFTPDEKQIITQVVSRVSDAVVCLLTEGLTVAMNQYN